MTDTRRHDPAFRGPVATATVKKALELVDASGTPALIELWESQDRTQAGGRPPYLNIRATLALWLIIAMEQQPMHIRRVALLLETRMTAKAARLLGIAYDPDLTAGRMYERARLATNRILRVTDAYPLKNRHSRLTKAEYAEELQRREEMKDVLDRRARRAEILRNQLLEANYQAIPAKFRPERISLSVDATRVRTHARGMSKARLATMNDDATVSAEPDMGFYQRGSNGKSAGDNAVAEGSYKRANNRAVISEYALEHEFGVLCSPAPSAPGRYPSLIVGLENHVPGVDPIGAARQMVDNLYERGHTLEHFVGDRAYMPKGDPDRLINPLRERGVKLVMDYMKGQLGLQAQKDGAILIDGAWYCPSMPKKLIDASLPYQTVARRTFGKTDPESKAERAAAQDVWSKIVAQRETYLFRPKEAPDERGRVPMMCPAAGNAPTATCGLKPNPKAQAQANRNKRPLLPIVGFAAPGKVCDNKTSTSFHINDGGLFEQYYQWGSKEWQAVHGHMRNRVESMNQYAKDDSTFALAAPGRRRMRGFTAQSFLVAMTIVAVNAQILLDFLLEHDEQDIEAELGIISPARRVNRTRRTSAAQRLEGLRRNRKRGDSLTART
ncbi:hypothetical protein [Microbacterium sp. Mcb102]|uniref:hypothetical protein n=1 Tax=Microbacterium sp. Mcb102 TaxID=2926012 RepID=UPI0021C8B8CD|nr:hypothetical protein [Microbacterium sp. Mcb102]